MLKWFVRSLVALVGLYGALASVVVYAMTRPPEQFGQIMKRLPAPVVWGALPARSLWMWARQGRLAVGDPAPDFTLPTHDHQATVTLSSFRGQKPVVLVFGSYT